MGSVTFTVVATSSSTLSYQWRKNGGNISGATASSYTITSVQANNAGTYSVKVTNAGGNVTSSGATLTILLPPTITTQPQNQTVVPGQNAAFSVVATGMSPWRRHAVSFKGTLRAGRAEVAGVHEELAERVRLARTTSSAAKMQSHIASASAAWRRPTSRSVF